jgi:hypothetical protein
MRILLIVLIACAPAAAYAAKKKPKPAEKTAPKPKPAEKPPEEPKDLNVGELFGGKNKPADPNAKPAETNAKPTETKQQSTETKRPAAETTTQGRRSASIADADRPNAFDIQLGARIFGRTLSLYDDLFGAFFPHRQPFAVAPSLKGAYFPGAHLSGGPSAWFGLHLLFDIAPGLRVRAPDGSLRNVTAFQVGGGLSARYPHKRFELRVDFGFVAQQFAFADPPAGTTATAQALSITYLSLRPAIALRVMVIERLWILAEGGYRIVLGTGDLKTMFPRSSSGGFDVAVGGAVPIAAGFEARATFDYAHYFFSMNPQPGDRYVLGGALDQYIGATVAVAFRR